MANTPNTDPPANPSTPASPNAPQTSASGPATGRVAPESPIIPGATATVGSSAPPGAAAGDGGGIASAAVAALSINRQRIPETVDFLGAEGAKLGAQLQPFRSAAVSRVFLGLDQIKTSLQGITQALTGPALPAQIIGVLHQPNDTPAQRVQITFDPTPFGGKPPATVVLTSDLGGFTLPMPSGASVPTAGIAFIVHGAHQNATVTIPAAQIAANGLVGVVKLPSPVEPLPESILASLKDILPPLQAPTDPTTSTKSQLPTVTIGENGPCQQEYNANNSIDSFPFNVFVRLVEPQLSIVNQINWVPLREGANRFLPLPVYTTETANFQLPGTITQYADRVPVEQPLSVDGFRDQIMGLEANGVFGADETVPMAATLGLGYVLEMQQKWTFAGIGLGDLVYSLPLAPGEQQQVAVFERVDTAEATETEFFSESEAEQQLALADTSTFATFNAAFNEASRGGSSFSTESSSGGFSIPLFGGGGASQSSGNAESWLQGQRNMAQAAAETTHSSAESQASARRTAMRTGMRLATASESESVTTKTVTNHNHAHALTMQYWQVIRNYEVTTVVDGLTLCCLVPMQIVRFMPPGQPLMLSNVSTINRPQLLSRYASLIKHLDVLQQAVPRTYQYGLSLLSQFAADPTATVDPAGGVAEDVITFSITGSFLPCETIEVRAVTRRNTRVGPVTLVATPHQDIPPNTFASRDELMAWLLQRRNAPPGITLSGNLALPLSMNRADIVGFEILRGFSTVSYTLISQEMQTLNTLESEFGSTLGSWIGGAIEATMGAGATARQTVTLAPRDLEATLGGPNVGNFSASILEFDGGGNPIHPANETYANDSLNGVELPPQPFPVPALQIGPVLRYTEILEIEKAMHHIVRNTTRYSKAVWSSLSAEERAILLDAYTIGVPADGIADPSQMVPLLNCIDNRLLGFFGNSMILPFRIPQVANGAADGSATLGLDQGEIERALLAYQQAGFQPPTSVISLPTRGVLGEAVLGCCPSAEKIDLTRFWNWQDSASDTAPTINPVTLPTTTPSIAAGLTAPNSLGALPPLINNVLQAPTPNPSLLQSLGQNFAQQRSFDTTLADAAQLASVIQNNTNAASQARADALKSSQALQQQAMGIIGGIVTGQGGQSGGKGGGQNGSSSGGSSGGSGGGGGSDGSSAASSAISAIAPILLAALL
ncbi:MAG TPA: hypothetical protein VMT68_01750 [Caulobacteraceae bacterium]|nr:hypothetical protein [Caulobacteraceae bacterium]